MLNHTLTTSIGLPPYDLVDVIRAERGELARRLARYRGTRPAVPVQGRTVVVVDDGLATGASARAAIQVLQRRRAQRVVLAVPVAPPKTVTALRGVADEVVALQTLRAFLAIGQFYDDFTATSDEEVTGCCGPGSQHRPWWAPPTTTTIPSGHVIALGPVRLGGDPLAAGPA